MSRIEKLKEYLQVSENDSFLQHALALEYIKIGNDEAAGELFDSILTREPSYVGSYYHWGKLKERAGDMNAAMDIYKKGMEEAKKDGDKHAYGELMGALEEIED